MCLVVFDPKARVWQGVARLTIAAARLCGSDPRGDFFFRSLGPAADRESAKTSFPLRQRSGPRLSAAEVPGRTGVSIGSNSGRSR